MIKAAIIGASGYAGYELIKLLKNHKKVDLTILDSITYHGKKVRSLYPDFKCDLKFTKSSFDQINESDVVFLALPSGLALNLAPKLKGKVIDLGADYRFSDLKIYENVYGNKHITKTNFVYGLPELFKDKIKKAKVIGNPGCYVTASLLSSLPIDKFAKNFIFDCKSGYSGAGAKKSFMNDEKNFTGNILPYNITDHRHKYEMQQFLSGRVSFTPHVIPAFRGLMSTAHILLKKKMVGKKIKDLFKKYYADHPFVKVVDVIPNLHDVRNTNYCYLGGFEVDENDQLVIISVIDNCYHHTTLLLWHTHIFYPWQKCR